MQNSSKTNCHDFDDEQSGKFRARILEGFGGYVTEQCKPTPAQVRGNTLGLGFRGSDFFIRVDPCDLPRILDEVPGYVRCDPTVVEELFEELCPSL